MGFFDNLGRLIRSNLNALVRGAEDPIKILDQSVDDMQEDLVKLRQAVAMAIASQKRLENQAGQAKEQIKNWFSRAELALKKGEDDLAKEALSRKKTFQETFESLSTQSQKQNAQVEKLKKGLLLLERKISEARTKKDMLKSRAQAAKAQRKIQDAVGDLGTNSSMDAFKRMEEKVEELEALGEASFELAGQDLESKFAELEGGNDIEKELEVLRSQLKSGVEAIALPPSDLDVDEVKTVEIQEVEIELEEMKKSMDKA
jgi:phage shock protein A